MTKVEKETRGAEAVAEEEASSPAPAVEYRSPRVVSYGSLTEITGLQGNIAFDGLAGTEDET